MLLAYMCHTLNLHPIGSGEGMVQLHMGYDVAGC